MKHQTNIAGEWRIGDIVIENREIERPHFCTAKWPAVPHFCTATLIVVDQVYNDGSFDYECPSSGVEKRSPQTRFTNISEMKRALGRV